MAAVRRLQRRLTQDATAYRKARYDTLPVLARHLLNTGTAHLASLAHLGLGAALLVRLFIDWVWRPGEEEKREDDDQDRWRD